MDAPCYCTTHSKETPFLDEASCSMELDTALHELGMLSRVTDSRTDYLREKMDKIINNQKKKQRSSNSFSSAPVCIVQMNSKFVTKFSLSKNSSSDCDSQEELDVIKGVELSADELILKGKQVPLNQRINECGGYLRRMRRRRERIMYTPYDLPWRTRLEDSLRYIPAAATVASTTERASSPVVSRQDSGNKSNPSSPVKSQNSQTTSGSSIVRSRSLDDLEIGKLDDCKEEDCISRCYDGRSDIDNVSQRISKLHVN